MLTSGHDRGIDRLVRPLDRRNLLLQGTGMKAALKLIAMGLAINTTIARADEVTIQTTQALTATTPVPGSQRVPSDVNGDGFSDLVWVNPFTKQVGYWLMALDSSGKVARLGSRIFPMGSGYFVGAVGDVDGDGYADLVFTSAQRDLQVWSNNRSGGFSTRLLGTYPEGWQLFGAGDVDGDGQDDLLWFNSQACEFGYWRMNKGARAEIRSISVGCGYVPLAIGYFSPSPRISIAWTSDLQDLEIWDSTPAGFVASNVTDTFTGNTLVGLGGGLAGNGVVAEYRQPPVDGDYTGFGAYRVLTRVFDGAGVQTSFSWADEWSGSAPRPAWGVGGAFIKGHGAQGAALMQQYGNDSMAICAPGASEPPYSSNCQQFAYPRGWFAAGAPANGTGFFGPEISP